MIFGRDSEIAPDDLALPRLEADSAAPGSLVAIAAANGRSRPSMHKLAAFINETGDTLAALARRVGVDASVIEAIINGADAPLTLAERIVAACDGAISIADLTSAPFVGGASRFARSATEIDVEALRRLLAPELGALLGGSRRAGDRVLASLAAEAAANTYLALNVTGRNGADRLALALEPVLKEILADFHCPPKPLDELARRIAATYFQAPQQQLP